MTTEDIWLERPAPVPLPETTEGYEYGTDWEIINAIQARWKVIALLEKPERKPFANTDAMWEVLTETLLPHVTTVSDFGLVNFRWLGVAFTKTLEEFRALEDRWVIQIGVKTRRAVSGMNGDDCNGTEWPAKAAYDALEDLAEHWGLGKVRWEDCEKGWGSFYIDLTPDTAMTSMLLMMGNGEGQTWKRPPLKGSKVSWSRSRVRRMSESSWSVKYQVFRTQGSGEWYQGVEGAWESKGATVCSSPAEVIAIIRNGRLPPKGYDWCDCSPDAVGARVDLCADGTACCGVCGDELPEKGPNV